MTDPPDVISTVPVVGAPVRDAVGDRIGTIVDVVCDVPTGRLRFAVLRLQGESRLLPVPWATVSFPLRERSALLNAAREQIQTAPRLEPAEWPHLTGPRWELYSPHWGGHETATVPTAGRCQRESMSSAGWLSLAVLITFGLLAGLGYAASRRGWSARTAMRQMTEKIGNGRFIPDPNTRLAQDRQRLVRRVAELERQAEIMEALQVDPVMDGARIRVRLLDGIADLEGTVTSGAQTTRAEALAKSFQGVATVRSALR